MINFSPFISSLLFINIYVHLEGSRPSLQEEVYEVTFVEGTGCVCTHAALSSEVIF